MPSHAKSPKHPNCPNYVVLGQKKESLAKFGTKASQGIPIPQTCPISVTWPRHLNSRWNRSIFLYLTKTPRGGQVHIQRLKERAQIHSLKERAQIHSSIVDSVQIGQSKHLHKCLYVLLQYSSNDTFDNSI